MTSNLFWWVVEKASTVVSDFLQQTIDMPDTSLSRIPHPFVVPQFTSKDYTSFFLAGAICCT